MRRGGAAQGAIGQEFAEPLALVIPVGLPFHELEPPDPLGRPPCPNPLAQHDLEAECRKIDIPRFDQRIEEGYVLGGQMEEIRSEVAHVEQSAGDQPLELAEGLPLEDRAHLLRLLVPAFAQDQVAEVRKQGLGRVPQRALQILLARQLRHLCQLALRQLEKPVHAVVDVGAVGRGGGLFTGEQLRDVGLRHMGGAGKIALLQPQFLESLPDHERYVHATLSSSN